MSKREVTEIDLRMPKFRDAQLEDLEFDGSGEIVRKDRFETSMYQISGMLHGVNGLSARSGWTCEQVVDAVKQINEQFKKLKQLRIAYQKFPLDAEFYHPENETYVRNIDQKHLQVAREDPKKSHLIKLEAISLNNDHYGWIEDSCWIYFIDVLMSREDIQKEINLIMEGEHE